MKLNVGAGDRKVPGWVGVDADSSRECADVVADARSIPLEDGVASELMAIHLIEHFYVWEVPDALNEWRRLLRPGGRLVLELPDLLRSCRNLISGKRSYGRHPDQLSMWGLYGDPTSKNPYMSHKWGWTFDTLAPVVVSVGFEQVVEARTQFHPIGQDVRDFRLEARKCA